MGDDHEWQATVLERTDPRGHRGCPFCSGRRTSKSTSLAALNPVLSGEWDRTLNLGRTPKDVRPGSSLAVWWRCAAGHSWRAKVSRRALGSKSGCPHCANLARRKAPSSTARAVTTRRAFGQLPTVTPSPALTLSRLTGARRTSLFDQYGVVSEMRLASLLGIDVYRLRKHLDQKDVTPDRVTDDHRWYRWRDLAAALKGTASKDNDPQPWRETLRGIRLSKRWVAGYPRLVAEWHPDKNGDLFPFQVTYGSGKAIWWKCPNGPDHEWRARPGTRTNPNGVGTNCPFCASHRASVTNSVATLRPDLARQWDRDETKFGPEDVTLGSRVRVTWRCEAGPDHHWDAALNRRVYADQGCPYCAHVRLSVTNSLSAVAPQVAAEWHPARNRKTAAQVFSHSTAAAWWRCSKDPRHIWRTTPANRVSSRAGCPACSDQQRRATTNAERLLRK